MPPAARARIWREASCDLLDPPALSLLLHELMHICCGQVGWYLSTGDRSAAGGTTN